MSRRTPAIAIALVVCAVPAAAIFAQSSTGGSAPTRSRYLPQYTASGELILPKNSMWREWVFVGSPLTPNALNDGHAGFPEYHNVYIEPGSYAIYKRTNVFPEGTILFKELQLTRKPEENQDGSRTEPSGRGYFPGEFNGADVTVKDSKRFADTEGWGLLQFQSSRAEGSDRQGEGKIGMRILSYRRREEGRGLDAVLPPAGQIAGVTVSLRTMRVVTEEARVSTRTV
jgi:Cytochrome P460